MEKSLPDIMFVICPNCERRYDFTLLIKEATLICTCGCTFKIKFTLS